MKKSLGLVVFLAVLLILPTSILAQSVSKNTPTEGRMPGEGLFQSGKRISPELADKLIAIHFGVKCCPTLEAYLNGRPLATIELANEACEADWEDCRDDWTNPDWADMYITDFVCNKPEFPLDNFISVPDIPVTNLKPTDSDKRISPELADKLNAIYFERACCRALENYYDGTATIERVNEVCHENWVSSALSSLRAMQARHMICNY